MAKTEFDYKTEYLTTSMVAKILKVSEQQVRNLVYRGQLKRVRYLNRNRYRLMDVRRLLEG